MNWRKLFPAPWVEQVKSSIARIDALPRRERLALLGAALALVGAVELLFVQPLRERREQIELATIEQVQREADERALVEQARVDAQTQSETQLQTIDRELASLGADGSSSQSLSFLLAKALARQDVRVVSLRELMVEDIQPEAVPDADAPAAPAAPAESATPAVVLYRHRYEVTLGGAPETLIDALRALDQGARPLRIERVRLQRQEQGVVQLAVTLMVIGTERAWLAI